ncbi:hypothetical protein ILYODFUR_036744 [Ilyodon furcidens]|uniref:Uncharacterized protein n=1 Tax=Ilyodon furcidens TaxID=33524 RepID=A0ABV0SS66_9TELE
MSSTPEMQMMIHPHSTSSTRGPVPSTPITQRAATARVLRKATPVPAHKRNRTDITVLTTDPASRWDKLTWQEIHGRWHTPRDGGPHHAPASTQTHHITATATKDQGGTPTSLAPPPPLSQSKCH